MSIHIDGPVTYLILKNKNGKIIELFGDYHEEVSKQTSCSDANSISFQQYMDKRFKSADKRLDFFVEIDPMHLQKHTSLARSRYTDLVDQFLNNKFNIDLKSGLISKSAEYPNVNLHIVDIRTMVFNDAFERSYILLELAGTIWQNHTVKGDVLKNLTDLLTTIDDIYKELYKLFYQDLSKFKSVSQQQSDIVHFIVSELNGTVKEHFDNHFSTSKKVMETIEELEKLHEIDGHKMTYSPKTAVGYGIPAKTFRTTITDLVNQIESIFLISLTGLASKIMDIYMVKEMMNPKINHAMSYTGLDHTVSSVFYLIKYFGFEIINYHHLSKPEEVINQMVQNQDIVPVDVCPNSQFPAIKDCIENLAKRSDNYITILPYFYPGQLLQCVKISN